MTYISMGLVSAQFSDARGFHNRTTQIADEIVSQVFRQEEYESLFLAQIEKLKERKQRATNGAS